MSQQVKWVKRPSIRPDDSGAAATLSRSPVTWGAASRVVARIERDESTRQLPILTSADGTGEVDLDDVLAVELLPGRVPTVSVNATCELQAEDVLAILPLLAPVPPEPLSVAPPPWVTDAPEVRFSAPPPSSRGRGHLGAWVAAATAAACLGAVLAAALVKSESATALVLPRAAHHAAAQVRAAHRLQAHASQIPVVSLASLAH